MNDLQTFQRFQEFQKFQVFTSRKTIHAAIIEYKEERKLLWAPSHLRSTDLSLSHLEDFCGPDCFLDEITHSKAAEFVIYISRKANKGYLTYFRVCRAMFNFYVERGTLNFNPFSKMKLPRIQELKPAYLDLLLLCKITAHCKNPLVADVINFGFFTGGRLSENVKIKRKSISLEKRLVIFGSDEFTTKSRKQRTVPLCNEAFAIVERRLNEPGSPNDYLFRKPDGFIYSHDYYSKCFKKCVRLAGADESLHFHSLRHSFASHLVSKGVSLYVVQQLLGHSSIKTTEIYAHLNTNALSEAVKVFD